MARCIALMLCALCGGIGASKQAIALELTSEQLCGVLEQNSGISSPSLHGGEARKTTLEDGRTLTITFRPRHQDWRLAIAELSAPTGEALFQARIIAPCTIVEARKLLREDGRITAISVLDGALQEKAIEPQNPEFKADAKIPLPTASPLIGLVDTGVNYLLAPFEKHLAIDRQGNLVGYDFWDDDPLPFDKDPRRNPFFPLHHGSTVFSVLSAEIDTQTAAIYRFPADNLCLFKALIEHAANAGVRILNMSMGSGNKEEWMCFYHSAQDHKDILFVVSAGNDAKRIDTSPVYPASFDLENMLVVTSADIFGRLGPVSNFSSRDVDVMVPAEQIEVIDHRGVRNITGGSSYAAPRIAALSARYLKQNPDASTQDIIAFIKARSIPASEAVTRFGWIPDPTDNFGF